MLCREYIQVHMDMYASIESTAHTDDDGQTKHAFLESYTPYQGIMLCCIYNKTLDWEYHPGIWLWKMVRNPVAMCCSVLQYVAVCDFDVRTPWEMVFLFIVSDSLCWRCMWACVRVCVCDGECAWVCVRGCHGSCARRDTVFSRSVVLCVCVSICWRVVVWECRLVASYMYLVVWGGYD